MVHAGLRIIDSVTGYMTHFVFGTPLFRLVT
jgi:hypothetical protein